MHLLTVVGVCAQMMLPQATCGTVRNLPHTWTTRRASRICGQHTSGLSSSRLSWLPCPAHWYAASCILDDLEAALTLLVCNSFSEYPSPLVPNLPRCIKFCMQSLPTDARTGNLYPHRDSHGCTCHAAEAWKDHAVNVVSLRDRYIRNW